MANGRFKLPTFEDEVEVHTFILGNYGLILVLCVNTPAVCAWKWFRYVIIIVLFDFLYNTC